MTIEELATGINNLVLQCTAPERDVYEALNELAYDWAERLEELEDEDDDTLDFEPV